MANGSRDFLELFLAPIRIKFGMHMYLVVLYAASAAALLILPVIVSNYGDSK